MTDTSPDATSRDHLTSPTATADAGRSTLAQVYSERQCPFDPPSELVDLRDSRPMSRIDLPGGQSGWLTTNHELARAVMGDQRFTRLGLTSLPQEQHAGFILDAIRRDPSFPGDIRAEVDRYRNEGRLIDAFRDPEVVQTLHQSPPSTVPFFMMDPAPHNRMRRILAPHFTVRRIERYRAQIEQIVGGRLDAMEQLGAPLDLFQTFAQPIAALMTCMMLGIPESEHETFERLSAAREDPNATADDLLAIGEKFRDFAWRQIERERAAPGDNVLTGLVQDGKMTDEELVITAVELADAAHRTTSATTTLAVATLLDRRERWESLQSESAPAIGLVVEELLRFNSLVQTNVRTALEDVELAGSLIQQGQIVVMYLPTANRDPHVFVDPDRLDPNRSGAGTHVAFGYGIHQCLGQHLARLTIGIAITQLVQRFPGLALTQRDADLSWTRSDSRVLHPERLPVTW